MLGNTPPQERHVLYLLDEFVRYGHKGEPRSVISKNGVKSSQWVIFSLRNNFHTQECCKRDLLGTQVRNRLSFGVSERSTTGQDENWPNSVSN